MVCTPGGKEAPRVPGTEPGQREVAPRSQAARGGGPRPVGAVPTGLLLLGPWLISASPLLSAG